MDESNPVGRPTDYKPEYNNLAFRLCLLGVTDKELAAFFEVSEATINNWKIAHPEFLESIRNGKENADMTIVQNLYHSAQDKIVIEQQAIKCKEVTWNDKGKRVEKETVEIVNIEKTIPADFRSMQFWLKNRKSDKWRDTQVLDHQSKGEKLPGVAYESWIEQIKPDAE